MLVPSRVAVIMPASRSTARCREIVGHDTVKLPAISPEVRGPLRSDLRMARRVGSARARKTAFGEGISARAYLAAKLISRMVNEQVGAGGSWRTPPPGRSPLTSVVISIIRPAGE